MEKAYPQINESIKKLQKNLSPEILEPPHLEWDTFLKQAQEVSNNYSELIASIPPEAKTIITCPTKFETYDAASKIGNMITIDITPEDKAQQEQVDYDYKEYFQDSLESLTEEQRLEALSLNISSHNAACEESVKRMEKYIDEYHLKVDNKEKANKPNMRSPKIPIFEFIDSGSF